MKHINKNIILELAKKERPDEVALAKSKLVAAVRAKIKTIPSNIRILRTYRSMVRGGTITPSKTLEHLLKKRKVRTLSGIASVSVILHDFPCLGKCIFCPTEAGLPKSYLCDEPAVMRAIANKFDPRAQVAARIKALGSAGHSTDKIELIVIGGTFSHYPLSYRLQFLKRCFDAANATRARTQNISPRIAPKKTVRSLWRELERAQKKNETTKNRIVGITAETRPDSIDNYEAETMRNMGITRVELGIQHLDNDILKKNCRTHTAEDTAHATRILRDYGFKITYHIMPGLFGSSAKKDEEMFKRLFSDKQFMPDYLKIYPCVVLKNTPLYKLWKQKKYHPPTDEELVRLLAKIKKNIPRYARIIRIIRDVPSHHIVAGGKISNLREEIHRYMAGKGWKCRCIRCREIKSRGISSITPVLFRHDYPASEGREVFLSFEDKKREVLFAFLRLRIPSCNNTILPFIKDTHKTGEVYSPFFKGSTPSETERGIFNTEMRKTLQNCAIVRELHTYGLALPIQQKKGSGAFFCPQHRGLGKALMKEAEKIAKKEFGTKKIAVISGIGAREYYKKLGYKLSETYMVKEL